mgnify:CR=1 FL=1
MPRDLPVGNGDLLLTFDHLYRARDLYYPRVGRHNHTAGHVQRFGVWADGKFAWVEDPGWTRELRYEADTLVTNVTLRHEQLGVELRCQDAVDYIEPVYIRRTRVRDLLGKTRDVRLFFHVDLSIGGQPVGDTANYDPSSFGVVFYKDDFYFIANACDKHKCGVDHWAIGAKRMGGHEGTWRDAEDGQLGRNAISQGSVDATVGFNLQVPANGETHVTSWLGCGRSYDEVKRLNRSVWELTPDRMLTRTAAYWRLWANKEKIDTSALPEATRELFQRSALVVRTQIDNGGAILAANDSDIQHFAGDHYSYCWPRDGALVADALIHLGQSELSRSFFRYCARVVEPDGFFLHKYTPEGQLASSWHPWTMDGERTLPVQQDETSLVLWALRRHFEAFRDVEFIKSVYEPLIARTSDWILSYRDHNGLPLPSWDLWEERRGVHTFTVAATIGALRAAAKFAEDFGERERAAACYEGAERMKGAARRHLYDKVEGRFARSAIPTSDGAYRLDMTPDSANYGLFAFGAFDAREELVEREMTELKRLLWVKTPIGGAARYANDYYHQVEHGDVQAVPGNPWVICTLWHALWKIERAQTIEELASAEEEILWTASRALPSGVLAEQFHPHNGAPISVSPLTWSHATYCSVVCAYLRKHAELRNGKSAAKATAPVSHPG